MPRRVQSSLGAAILKKSSLHLAFPSPLSSNFYGLLRAEEQGLKVVSKIELVVTRTRPMGTESAEKGCCININTMDGGTAEIKKTAKKARSSRKEKIQIRPKKRNSSSGFPRRSQNESSRHGRTDGRTISQDGLDRRGRRFLHSR